MASILVRGINTAQRRSVCQTFLRRQTHILLNPPQEISAAGPRLIPQIKSEEKAIRQTQHPRAQVLNSPLSKLQFSRPVASHLSAKQHMGPIFHHRDKSQLGKGTLASARCRASESLSAHLFIGHIHGAPIQTHQMPSSIPGPFCLLCGDGPDQVVMQALQGLHPQSCTGLRNTRFARNFDSDPRVQQPLNSFQQTAHYLPVGGLHVEDQHNHVINYNVGWQVPLTNAVFACTGQNRFHFLEGKRLSQHPKAHIISDPTPLREFCKCSRHLHTSWNEMAHHNIKVLLSEQYWV